MAIPKLQSLFSFCLRWLWIMWRCAVRISQLWKGTLRYVSHLCYHLACLLFRYTCFSNCLKMISFSPPNPQNDCSKLFSQSPGSAEQAKIESCLSDLVNTSAKFKDLLQVGITDIHQTSAEWPRPFFPFMATDWVSYLTSYSFTGGPDRVKHNSHKASGETLDKQLPVHLTQHRGGNGLTALSRNKWEGVKHVALTSPVPRRKSLMITRLMIPGCSSSSLTWSSSWESSRCPICASF